MNLREEYNKIDEYVARKFHSIEVDYDHTAQALDEYEGDERRAVEELLSKKSFKDIWDYSFPEFLHQVYFGNNRGEEVMGYLLRIKKGGRIVILESEELEVIEIPYILVNTLDGQIELLELMGE